MAGFILSELQERFPSEVVATGSQHGNETCVVTAAGLLPVAGYLKQAPHLAFNMPIDCTALDYLGKGLPYRFEVVWHLYSLSHKHRLRLKVQLPQEAPRCPSLTALWPGMNWHEREAYDMYGIVFSEHPDLRRVLMYEPFEGHPLRKDYPIARRQPLLPMRPVTAVPTQRQAPAQILNQP